MATLLHPIQRFCCDNVSRRSFLLAPLIFCRNYGGGVYHFSWFISRSLLWNIDFSISSIMIFAVIFPANSVINPHIHPTLCPAAGWRWVIDNILLYMCYSYRSSTFHVTPRSPRSHMATSFHPTITKTLPKHFLFLLFILHLNLLVYNPLSSVPTFLKVNSNRGYWIIDLM